MLDIASCNSRDSFSRLFMATLNEATAGGRFNRLTVFADWLEAATLSFGNVFRRDPEIEKHYKKLAERYGKEFELFPKLLAITVAAIEFLDADFLGHIYMSSEMGNSDAGQFFTPDCVSILLNDVTLSEACIQEAVDRHGYISIQDPACGGGVMLIHAFNKFKSLGKFGARQFYVEGWDLDFRCVCMTYIQLSLLGVPAVVRHINTLSMEEYSAWGTPLYYLEGFPRRMTVEFNPDAFTGPGACEKVQEPKILPAPVQQTLFDLTA